MLGQPTVTDRLTVFVDWQNVYRAALQAFHPQRSRVTDGQVDPVEVADLLLRRGPGDQDRELAQVRVYTGRPDPNKNAKTFNAHMRQCAAWERAGATVVTRPLQYLPGQPPREKGIDVQIAMDMVIGGIEREFDVAILFSVDTDLLPPLQYLESSSRVSARVEAAAWHNERYRRRLYLPPPTPLWCHFLDQQDYHNVRDLTDYRPRR